MLCWGFKRSYLSVLFVSFFSCCYILFGFFWVFLFLFVVFVCLFLLIFIEYSYTILKSVNEFQRQNNIRNKQKTSLHTAESKGNLWPDRDCFRDLPSDSLAIRGLLLHLISHRVQHHIYIYMYVYASYLGKVSICRLQNFLKAPKI